MSSRRKTYDGSSPRGSSRDSKRRDSADNQVEIDEHASEKRSRSYSYQLDGTVDEYSASEEKDRYLITYADLITLLLGLFIILYAMSNIDLEKYKEAMTAFEDVFGSSGEISGIKSPSDFVKNNRGTPNLMESLENVIIENGYSDAVRLIENERGITISILDNILFASGNAELNDDSRIVLSELSSVIKTIPNDLRIEGHTDNIPITSPLYPSNWHLSVERATNTAYYLMTEEEIPQDRVSIVGYSEYKPMATNETPEGRAQNRRVDIIILNNI